MPTTWKPTSAECAVIRAAAGLEVNAPPRGLVLQPGWRFNTTRADVAASVNVALVSDDADWGDTDLADYGRWAEFRKGVELTADGRAIVDFYVYRKGTYEELLGNVTVYYQAGRITRIHGYPGEYPTELAS